MPRDSVEFSDATTDRATFSLLYCRAPSRARKIPLLGCRFGATRNSPLGIRLSVPATKVAFSPAREAAADAPIWQRSLTTTFINWCASPSTWPRSSATWRAARRWCHRHLRRFSSAISPNNRPTPLPGLRSLRIHGPRQKCAKSAPSSTKNIASIASPWFHRLGRLEIGETSVFHCRQARRTAPPPLTLAASPSTPSSASCPFGRRSTSRTAAGLGRR